MESDENGVFDHSTGTPAENIEALDNMAEGKKFILSLPAHKRLHAYGRHYCADICFHPTKSYLWNLI